MVERGHCAYAGAALCLPARGQVALVATKNAGRVTIYADVFTRPAEDNRTVFSVAGPCYRGRDYIL